MRRLRSVSDRNQAERLRQALENAGIAAVTRREVLPLSQRRRDRRELALEVCVEDGDFDRASTILAALDVDECHGDPWSCVHCEEELTPATEVCPQCGEERG